MPDPLSIFWPILIIGCGVVAAVLFVVALCRACRAGDEQEENR